MWIKIILALLPVILAQEELISRTVHNLVIIQSLGLVINVENHHSFIFKIYCKQLYNHYEELEQQLKMINVTNVPIKEISNSKRLRLQKVQSNLNQLCPSRTKRSPLNIIGNTANWLFGVMSETDRKLINNAFQTLTVNQNNLLVQQNLGMSLLKSVSNRFNETLVKLIGNQEKIQNNLKELTKLIRKEEKEINTVTTLMLFEENLHIYENLVETIKNSIMFSYTNSINPMLFQLQELEQELKLLKQIYGQERVISLKNNYNLYKIVHSNSFLLDGEILFSITFPIKSPHTYDLLQVTPTLYKNHYPILRYSYVILNENYYETRSSLCPKIEEKYFCQLKTRPKILSNCIIPILENKPENCLKVRTATKENWIEKIASNRILINTNQEVEITYECQQKGKKFITTSTLIETTNLCKIKTLQEDIFMGEEHTKKIYELPKLKTINTNKVIKLPNITFERLNPEIFINSVNSIDKLQNSKLKLITKQNNYNYYFFTSICIIILILLAVNIKNFKIVINKIKNRFVKYHQEALPPNDPI